jgi:hypothetical protein
MLGNLVNSAWNSTRRIVIGAGLVGLLACGGKEEENVENPGSSSSDVEVKSGYTNDQGEIVFTDQPSGEDVRVQVTDTRGNDVGNALVTYFDALAGFEAYMVNHQSIVPLFRIFAHNSDQDLLALSLTTASLQVHQYSGTSNGNSQAAATQFVDWLSNGWEYMGCWTEEETESVMQGGVWIIEGLSYLFSLGVSSDGVEQAADYLKEEVLTENTASHIYLFNPSDFGISGTSTIWTLEVRTIRDEILGNGIDDDCDGSIDESDAAECSPGQLICYDGHSFAYADNCDLVLQDECSTTEYCERGVCLSSSEDVGYDRGSDAHAPDMGSDLPTERFVNLGDGTVRDNDTGYVWMETDAGVMNWDAGIAYCEGLTFAGSSSWVLPTVDQLQSIDRAAGAECDLYEEFAGVCSTYWTSGEWPEECSIAGWARFVAFQDFSGSTCSNKSDERYIRCLKD